MVTTLTLQTDFDDDDETATQCKPGPPIEWIAERGSDYPVSLRKKKLPTGEGHRHLMSSHGFAAELVERAIQELGLIALFLFCWQVVFEI